MLPLYITPLHAMSQSKIFSLDIVGRIEEYQINMTKIVVVRIM